MKCFSCCMSDETLTKWSLQKSIKEHHDTKVLASYANISFDPDDDRKRLIGKETTKGCKGNATAKVFKYDELCDATNNFNPRNQIGEGGFGRVYRGLIENPNRAKPLMDHRRKFVLLADPLLDGECPVKGLHQALTVAAMCLQEEPSLRPLMSYVVAALEGLITSDEPEEGKHMGNEHHTSSNGGRLSI
ncbi:hypothetical protein V6N12_002474 [Hibiscus sabdariffa]|uniref:Protein kinase domain-containing protein n=1 Tax=Hibiscus sabdariffa TaxID=183260 RepID=A0ABR2B4G3_9ROSI